MIEPFWDSWVPAHDDSGEILLCLLWQHNRISPETLGLSGLKRSVGLHLENKVKLQSHSPTFIQSITIY
ncbi:hypothetical protein [Flavobacterium ovatum]|uniref:hypothetical protein n=1 Tax=Flavobacterium ovatum TaxID=1928857 RepID=UPI00344C46A2